MKKKFLILWGFVLSLSLTIQSCRNESLALEQEEQQKFSKNIAVLDKKEFENKLPLYQKVEQLRTSFFRQLAGKTSTPQDSILDGAVIETDHVLEITDGTKKTYTIPISRTFPNSKLENLVLRENSDNTYSGLLLQYNLTQEEKERYKNGQPVDLTGKIKSYSINNLSIADKGSTYSYWDGCMEYVYETNPCTTGYNHAYGDGTCEVLGTSQAAQPASLIAAIDHCAEGSTGGGGGFGGGIGGGGSTGGGSTGGGGSSGGGTGGSTNPDAYNTFIFFSFDDMFNICPDGDAGCQAETQLNIQVQQYLLSLPPHVSSLASYNGVLFTIKDYFRTMGYGDDVLTQNLTHIATWFNAQNNTDPTVKLNNFKFVNFALNFLIQNPETTWLEFESWFITKSNGSDGEYISNLDDILNTIQYQTKQMPTYSQFVNAFPKLDYAEYPGYYKQMPASQVYSIVGDPLKSLYLSTGGDNGNYRNACTVRWSLAMNNLGILIPQNSLSLRGADVNGQPRYYYIRATTAGDAMQKIFGNPTHKLEGAEANDAVNVAKFLDGKTGIYVIINANSTLAGYTGHVDLIQNGYIPGGSNHTNVPGGIKSIRIWEFTP